MKPKTHEAPNEAPNEVRNEVWKAGAGELFGYSQDLELLRRVKRYKPKWRIVGNYYDSTTGKRVAFQVAIPIEEKRAAFRMFGVSRLSD